MAIDPQTLFNEAKCYECFGLTEDEALELALLARIAVAGFGPAAPSDLLVRLTTTFGNNILDWTASSGAAPTTYEIWRSVNGGAYAQVGTVGGGVTTFTHAVVVPVNDQWYYKVRACTGGVCSAFTDPAGIFNTFSKLVNTGTVVYSFPFLQFVFNDFAIGNEVALTTVSTPKLRKTTGQYIIVNNAVFTTLDASSLITGQGVGVAGPSLITAISFPALTSSTDYFTFRDNASLVSVSAPLLSTVSSQLQFQNTTALVSVNLPSLTVIGSDITGQNSGAQTISMPLLISVGASITCTDLHLLTTINLPLLQSVLAPIDFTNALVLTSVSFPSLTTVGDAIFFTGSANLVTVSIPVALFADIGIAIDFNACLLNAASVNGILARGVASATTTDDYELNTPGNAAPTGQGLLDKATLIGLGNTVNTN